MNVVTRLFQKVGMFAGVMAACAAMEQSLGIGSGGLSVTDGATMKRSADRVGAGRELDMAELPVNVMPPSFYLLSGTSGRYGPYALADGTRVGSEQAPYTLRMFDYGSRFTLQPAAHTNQVYGPFSATNGAPVVIGNAGLAVRRIPAELLVSLSHPGKINQMPLIGIAPLSVPVLKELYNLRAKYMMLANRVNQETADVEFAGVPRIHSPVTGNMSSPVVRRSSRDVQNSVKGAERSAITFLESLFNQYFRYRSQAITDGSTYHFRVPPGDYLLCALQRVKDPDAQGVSGAAMAVWWTPFAFDGEHPLSVALNAENAITWRDIFAMEKKSR